MPLDGVGNASPPRRGRSSASRSLMFRTCPPCSNFTAQIEGSPIFVTQSQHRGLVQPVQAPAAVSCGVHNFWMRFSGAASNARPGRRALPLPQDSHSECAMPETVLKIDTGDTAWLLMSSALVMLMTPALGFFYGGLV